MQEHAEEPRSLPLRKCVHCGATLKRDVRICPKCDAEQPADPTDASTAPD